MGLVRKWPVLLLFGGAILVLLVGYSLQVFTPLRLEPDSVILLSIADSLAHGGNDLFEGKASVYPPGYPLVAALLLRVGLPYTSALVALNLICMCAGLIAVFYLFRQSSWQFSAAVCILSALSFVFIRHTAIPATDVCFFGVTMCCLTVMRSIPRLNSGVRFIQRVIAAWMMVLVAMSLRRIGLALIPAFIWSMASHPQMKAYVMRCSVWARLVALLAFICVGGITALVASKTLTLQDWRSEATMLRDESQIVRFRLGELGELALNAVGYPELDEGRGYVSSVMVPRSLQGTMPVIGALILAIMSMGAVWSEFTVTEVYFVSYLAIIFVWPYYDTRFWLPIIPLVIAYSGRTLKQFYRYPICRALTCGYVTAFAGVGLWWLVASTVITFAGSDFPNVYQEGYYHATYCSFYHSCNKSTPQSFPDVPVSQSALRVLRTYK